MFSPRLNVNFSLKNQMNYLFGRADFATDGTAYYLNFARTGLAIALKASIRPGAKVAVMAYNCNTVANAIEQAGCVPVFVDVKLDLTIDIDSLSETSFDAIILSNLFGIRNNVITVRKVCPNAIIIIDNAHGFGLPDEGDFTVYSINQGKFPSLGPGGILKVNNSIYLETVKKEYLSLSEYNFKKSMMQFISMFCKSILYSGIIYKILTVKLKSKCVRHTEVKEAFPCRKMSRGVYNLFIHAEKEVPEFIKNQKNNAELIINALKKDNILVRPLLGENAFMLVLRCEDVDKVRTWFNNHNVETATHFKHCISWNEEFGYVKGSCPNTEYLVNHLLMVPTYRKIKI